MTCPHALLASADGGCPLCPAAPPAREPLRLRALRELARRELARREMLDSFTAFVRGAWHVLHPGTEAHWGPHLDAICEHAAEILLELLRARRDPAYVMRWSKLLINVPPRSAKSMIVAVMLPAFAWLHDATLKIRVVSGNPTLAVKHSGFLRDLLDSRWYRETFNVQWEVRGDIDAAGRFQNTARGEVRCHTIGAKVIGEGSDLTIVDDPHDSEEAKSEKKRLAVLNRFDTVLSNRVIEPRANAWIGIMQRVHEDDWSGHVLRQGGWRHLPMPLLFEIADPYCRCSDCLAGATFLGWKDWRTEEGQNLLPVRYTDTFIAGERAKGAFYFAGQWQQRPAPAEGGLVKKAWLRYQDADQMPARFDRLLISVDAATKAKDHERGSNTSMQLFGEKRPNKYLLENLTGPEFDIDFVLRYVRALHLGIVLPPPGVPIDPESPLGRVNEWLGTDRRKPFVADPSVRAWWATRAKVGAVLVEDTVMGSSVCDVLEKELTSVVRMKPRESGGRGAGDDKVTRLLACQPDIMGGNLILLRGAPWLDSYVHELTTFPNGSKDDQVDATSQCLNFTRGSDALASFLRWQDVKVR